jgi:ribosomal protein S6
MRELAYEMIRVQNNINVRFNEAYFGWIKFEISADKIKDLDKSMKLDEEVVRYLIVTTVRENTVYTKRAPVIKAEKLAEVAEEAEVNIDTTGDVEGVTDTATEGIKEASSEETK